MRILNNRLACWTMDRDCPHCGSTLRIHQGDLRVVLRGDYNGQGLSADVVCAVCKKPFEVIHFRDRGIPSGLLAQRFNPSPAQVAEMRRTGQDSFIPLRFRSQEELRKSANAFRWWIQQAEDEIKTGRPGSKTRASDLRRWRAQLAELEKLVPAEVLG